MKVPVASKQQVTNPLQDALLSVIAGVNQWKSENSAEFIQFQVKQQLDKNAKTIIMKLLGFNDSWGREFELDHCNGRAGNSATGDYLRSKQQEAINTWLDQVPMPVLTDKEKASLSNEFKREYMYELNKQIQKLAEEKALKEAQTFIEEVTNMRFFNDYLKLRALIDSQQQPTT